MPHQRTTLKSILFSAIAIAIGACGVDFDVGNGFHLFRPFDISAEQANEVIAISQDLARLEELSGGIDSVVPDVQTLLKRSGLAETPGKLKTSPVFSPQGVNDNCFVNGELALPGDSICRIAETKTYIDGPILQEDIVALAWFTGEATPPVIALDYYATKQYADGSTGYLHSLDTEAPNGTTAADLGRHIVALTESRVYPDDNSTAASYMEVKANFHGTSDDSSEKDRKDAADETDEFYSVFLANTYADGTTNFVSFVPTYPVTSPNAITAGTMTNVVTFVEGEVTATINVLHWDKEAEVAQGATVVYYADATTEVEVVTIQKGLVQTVKVERDGSSVAAQLNTLTGEYVRQHVLPAGSDITVLTEAGTVSKDEFGYSHIEVAKHIEYQSGITETSYKQLTQTANDVLEVVYVNTYDGEITSRGSIVITQGAGNQMVVADSIVESNIQVHVDAVVYPGGTAKIELTADDPATQTSPDFTAKIQRFPDGSETGTVRVDGVLYELERQGDGSVLVDGAPSTAIQGAL